MSVCGTVPGNLTLEALSRARRVRPLRSPVGSLLFATQLKLRIFPTVLNTLSLEPGQPTPGRDFPYASLHRNYQMYRNINLFPIDYAFRPRLRGRLTLGRRTLPRKPSAFGGEGSHLPFRYSCSAFSLLIPPATLTDHLRRLTECSPTPISKLMSRSFGTMLSPVTLSAHDYSTSELLRTLSRSGCF